MTLCSDLTSGKWGEQLIIELWWGWSELVLVQYSCPIVSVEAWCQAPLYTKIGCHSGLYIKWCSIIYHLLNPAVYYHSFLDGLQYLTQCKYYVDSCYTVFLVVLCFIITLAFLILPPSQFFLCEVAVNVFHESWVRCSSPQNSHWDTPLDTTSFNLFYQVKSLSLSNR
jgi:hypothetical protein